MCLFLCLKFKKGYYIKSIKKVKNRVKQKKYFAHGEYKIYLNENKLTTDDQNYRKLL